MFERGNLRLHVEPGCVVLERGDEFLAPDSERVKMDVDELRWLILAAGPAVLAEGIPEKRDD